MGMDHNFSIALNGKLPTIDEVKALINQEALPSYVDTGEVEDYEENMSFARMEICWGETTLLLSGYTGLWELQHFNRLKTKEQRKAVSDLLDWIDDCMDDAGSDLTLHEDAE